MSEKILKNKTLYTVQIYNQSVNDHTVNFATKEIYDKYKTQVSDELFLKEDVLDAVELIKEKIKKLYVTKTKKVVMNSELQEMGVDTTIKQTRIKLPFNAEPIIEIIENALPDLYSNGETMEEEEKTQEEEKEVKEGTDESTENKTASEDVNTDEAEKTEDAKAADEEKTE